MQGEAEGSTAAPSPSTLATMSAFNHVYNIKEYFYISPVDTQNKVCPAHNNLNSVTINKVDIQYCSLCRYYLESGDCSIGWRFVIVIHHIFDYLVSTLWRITKIMLCAV